MPAYKPYDEANVGKVVQTDYKFLNDLWNEEKLWGPRDGERTLRDHLFALSDEAALRAALAAQGIVVDPPPGSATPVRIMIVDIENARTKTYGTQINPGTDFFYVLVLPPKLRRQTEDPTKRDYMRMQAWSGAWYHASNDGYGM